MDDKILEAFEKYSVNVDDSDSSCCLLKEDWIGIVNEICLITEDKINEIVLKEREGFVSDLRRIRQSIK